MFTDKKNIIFLVIIFVGVTLFTIFSGNSANITFDLKEDSIVISGPSDYSYTILLDDIDETELRVIDDFGQCISGDAGKKFSYGEFENTELGRYNLCALTKLSTCIVVTDKENTIYVFNFENASTTTEFHKTFTEYLDQRS